MGTRGKKDLIVPITSEEAFDKYMEESDKLCLLIDVHQDWCGSTEVLEPTFRKMWMEIPDCDNVLKFLTANLSILGKKIKSILPHDAQSKLDHQGCQPLFLIVRSRQVVGTVSGVNTPSIQQLVNQNLPDRKKQEE